MSLENNKASVARFSEELWNLKNYDIFDELCTPEFVAHDLPSSVSPNKDGFKGVAMMIHNAFPDAHLTVEDTIADKDKVVLRWNLTATHQGEFMGIPATNRKVSWSGITIYRIAGAKVVEWWNKSDLSAVPQQLK
jgi:steroid delta-isomerase-like uncharacterized protein